MLSSFNAFLEASKAAAQWKSKLIFNGTIPKELTFIYNNPATDGFIAPYPICDFIQRKPFSLIPGSCFKFDPSKYPNRSDPIIKLLKNDIIDECRNEGFEVTSRIRLQPKRRNRSVVIEFKCAHNSPILERKFDHKKHALQPGTKKPTAKMKKTISLKKKVVPCVTEPCRKIGQNIHQYRKVSSKRPIREEDRCPFQFTIFYDDDTANWYLRDEEPSDQSAFRDPNFHKGHFCVNKNCIKSPHISLSELEIKLALQCDLAGIDPTQTAKILEGVRGDGSCLTVKQMQYIKAKAKAQKELNNFQEGSSSAERLLHSFDQLREEGHGVHYSALVHHYDYGFKIKNSRGRPRGIEHQLGNFVCVHNYNFCRLSNYHHD
jgi:hypothetical protein